MKRILAVLIIAIFILPVFGTIAHAQQTGPATEEIEWISVGLEQVANALETGQIDVYIFGLRPAAAQQLAGKPGVKLYQAFAGLVDIGLNPAPVMVVALPGQHDKASAAQALGIDPVAIAYVTYIPPDANLDEINDKPFVGVTIDKTDITIVELCAKPLAEVAQGEILWESDKYEINPFCFRDIRFALNYVIDRDFIIKNIYKGFAIAKYTFYGPDDPTYVELIDVIAKYKFGYNPDYARAVVTDTFTRLGAEMKGGIWYYKGKPVQVIGIIRQEDERLDIGNYFADQLEKVLGIKVLRQILPFGEAIPKVYFTDPRDFEWGFYTEGWGKGAIDRWDPWNLAQFAAAWLGWSPGWGDTTYWNYRNDTIDEYSRATALGQIKSKEEFIDYIRKGTELGILESIRIWIAATLSTNPAVADIRGVTLDLGAGLRNPFFYRGVYKPGSDKIVVGHLHVFTASTIWQIYGGFDDVYSVDPMRATWDPFIWRHPFNGEPIAFRTPFTVETAGPEGKLAVPDDAIWWDAENDKWVYAKDLGRTEATSKVVFDMSKLIGAKWHHGQTIDWADVLAAWAVILDITYDPVKSSLESSIAGPNKESFDRIMAIKIDPYQNTLEVYLNYWHFDPAYIADFAVLSLYNPAELLFAHDYLAFVKKTYALSDTRSKAENLPHLNLVLEDHAKDIAAALEEMDFGTLYKSFITLPDGTIPVSGGDVDAWFQARKEAVKEWIAAYKHAWISDGPFMLVEFSKDKDMLRLKAFRDPTYPFGPTDWVFGEPTPTSILSVNAPIVEPGQPARITVTASGLPPVHVKYIIRDPATGKVLAVGEAIPSAGAYVIELPPELTDTFEEYSAYELTVIAYSEQVALPAERVVTLQTTARVTEQIGKVSEAVSAAQEQIRAAQEQIAQLQEQLRATQEQMKQLQQQLQALGETLGEQFAAQLQQLVNTMTQQITTLADQVTALSKQVGALGDAVGKVAQQADSIAGQVAAISDTLGNLATKSDVKAVSDEVEALSSDVSAASSKANLAFIVSVINLVLLLAVLGLLFTRRSS